MPLDDADKEYSLTVWFMTLSSISSDIIVAGLCDSYKSRNITSKSSENL